MAVLRPDRQYRKPPNQAGIAMMPDADILEVREMWIASLVNHWRNRNSNADADDGIKLALDWLSALTGEMRIRGSSSNNPGKVTL